MTELPYNPASLTVMVVDDHDPIRKAIRRVLLAQGFESVIECFDGADAIKILEKKAVDLVISDIYMRKVSGFDLLRSIRERSIATDIPVILVTGETGKEDIVKSADLGADNYLLKPFQAGDLEKKIQTVLTRYFAPNPAVRMLRSGERLLLEGKLLEALKTLDGAIQLDPKSIRAKHSKAVALWRMGQQTDALTLLDQLIAENPAYYRSFSTRADILNEQGQQSEAIDAMKKELALNPKQIARQMTLAKMLLKALDYEGAIHHYRVALQENPKQKIALLGMGHAYARSENLEKALYYFKRVRRYHPTATAALEAIVKYCTAVGQPKRAEHMLKDEKNSNPKRMDTYLILADLLMQQERWEEALSVVDEVLKLSPEFVEALLVRGRVCMKLRNFTEAVVSFNSAWVLSPSMDTAVLLAEALTCEGDHERCMTLLESAMLRDPNHTDAALLLANAYRSCQEFTKALVMFRKAAFIGADPKVCNAEAKSLWQDILARRRSPRKIAS